MAVYNPMQFQPNYYQPQNQFQTPFAPQVGQFQHKPPMNNLIRVTGYEGSKAFEMGENSTVVLFDSNEDLFYLKTTDGAGFPTIRTFQFSEIVEPSKPKITEEYVSREEFNKFKEELLNGKQHISEQPKSNKQQNKSASSE